MTEPTAICPVVRVLLEGLAEATPEPLRGELGRFDQLVAPAPERRARQLLEVTRSVVELVVAEAADAWLVEWRDDVAEVARMAGAAGSPGAVAARTVDAIAAAAALCGWDRTLARIRPLLDQLLWDEAPGDDGGPWHPQLTASRDAVLIAALDDSDAVAPPGVCPVLFDLARGALVLGGDQARARLGAWAIALSRATATPTAARARALLLLQGLAQRLLPVGLMRAQLGPEINVAARRIERLAPVSDGATLAALGAALEEACGPIAAASEPWRRSVAALIGATRAAEAALASDGDDAVAASLDVVNAVLVAGLPMRPVIGRLVVPWMMHEVDELAGVGAEIDAGSCPVLSGFAAALAERLMPAAAAELGRACVAAGTGDPEARRRAVFALAIEAIAPLWLEAAGVDSTGKLGELDYREPVEMIDVFTEATPALISGELPLAQALPAVADALARAAAVAGWERVLSATFAWLRGIVAP